MVFNKLFRPASPVAVSVVPPSALAREREEGYPEIERLIRSRIAAVSGPLFVTDADHAEGLQLGALFHYRYLAQLDLSRRQHYRCRACQRFITTYGPLATIGADGKTTPLLWAGEDATGVPPFFAGAFASLHRAVSAAKVVGVYYSEAAEWGVEKTPSPKSPEGYWTHLSGRPPESAVYRNPLKTAFQAAAERREEMGVLERALEQYPLRLLREAARVLGADALDRGEKARGVAAWLVDLAEALHALPGPPHRITVGERRRNLLWLAVATAPAGFAHVKNTVISTLLDDLRAGLSYEEVARRWGAKMDPLSYQRPKAPPSAGAIAAAEKTVGRLASAGALRRRYARLSEVPLLWCPAVPVGPKETGAGGSAGGVFGHLKPKATTTAVRPLELPAKAVTWEKFARDVLPTADRIEAHLPSEPTSLYGLVTAADPNAPPILQWDGVIFDHETRAAVRNPVSWYFYARGAAPEDFGLTAGWAPVSGVFREPPRWYLSDTDSLFSHFSPIAFFAIPSAKDRKKAAGAPGGGFFPEILLSEYYSIRSVMEAYAEGATIEGADEGNANGIAFQKCSDRPLLVRVTSGGGVSSYRIDRWD